MRNVLRARKFQIWNVNFLSTFDSASLTRPTFPMGSPQGRTKGPDTFIFPCSAPTVGRPALALSQKKCIKPLCAGSTKIGAGVALWGKRHGRRQNEQDRPAPSQSSAAARRGGADRWA